MFSSLCVESAIHLDKCKLLLCRDSHGIHRVIIHMNTRYLCILQLVQIPDLHSTSRHALVIDAMLVIRGHEAKQWPQEAFWGQLLAL